MCLHSGLSTPPPEPEPTPPAPSSSEDSGTTDPDVVDAEPTGFILANLAQADPYQDLINTPDPPRFLRNLLRRQETLGTLSEEYHLVLAAFNALQQSFQTVDTAESTALFQVAIDLSEEVEDRLENKLQLELAELNQIVFPDPPGIITHQPIVYLGTMLTPAYSSVSDSVYKFPALSGRENYALWRIQMQDMFEETELWPIINKSEPLPGPTQGTSSTGTATTTQPLQTDINNWNKRNRQALGMIRRRIESAPMTHIARCTNSFEAWDVLARLYQSIGSGAMILLRNRFSNLRMSEGDNLEDHIKKLRKVFDELNIALLAEGSTTIKELEFIRQLLASLPESWQIIVSIIDQTPDATDPDGITLSQNIQSRLLNEYQRRSIATGEVAMYIKPKRASDCLTISCNNCRLKGHIIDECYKPGGLAYKGKNSNIRGRGRGKKRGGYRNKGNRGNQE
ncbi:gag-polypeptide of LTR copia-type [Ceratobasidium sp. AG-Ba]|nr:gag-polypeptide of LTR copia-type [Ceratobasidium sp. AG-Ba]